MSVVLLLSVLRSSVKLFSQVCSIQSLLWHIYTRAGAAVHAIDHRIQWDDSGTAYKKLSASVGDKLVFQFSFNHDVAVVASGVEWPGMMAARGTQKLRLDLLAYFCLLDSC